jgi:predicted DCC family thiol-disulfide oxidoreductase YuxK
VKTYLVTRFTLAGANGSVDKPPCRDCYTVVYDGHCTVCTRIVEVLRSWDGEDMLDIVASQAPGVQARFPWIPAGAYAESVQVIAPDGKTFQGAAAVEELLRVLPRGKFVSWIFFVPGIRGIAERLYRWIARNRYKLGCGDHCQRRPEHLNYDDGTD